MAWKKPIWVATTLAAATISGCGGSSFESADQASDEPMAIGKADHAAGLAIRIRATTTPFAHEDGLAGQTAQRAAGGVRSLALYRYANDPRPLVLFNYGRASVEVGYNHGSDTLVARVPASRLKPGHYTLARMVQAYSRYRTAAVRHTLRASTPGAYDNLQVLSDRSMVGGVMRNAGHYEYVFRGGGEIIRLEGEDFVVPSHSSTAGAQGIVENGEWAVYFPIDLKVTASPTTRATLTIDVNMYRAFRWIDNAWGWGYRPEVFDTTPYSHEMVVRFGGNEFAMTLR